MSLSLHLGVVANGTAFRSFGSASLRTHAIRLCELCRQPAGTTETAVKQWMPPGGVPLRASQRQCQTLTHSIAEGGLVTLSETYQAITKISQRTGRLTVFDII
ncbi:MAG: hypothetical protein DRI39_04630 [Chloroflexi bacterium]|nr:MAG: hypothetical protein DRI39_04630 [Chloroflexota bacterium]RLC96596.1 MAG: hypothetical protein DRI40_02665 [Chloroflexota bacterium]